ncbi:MAG: hypothetical protein M3415_03730 [Actinomycetota bacterium]|jgi:hypothetical protein|nr:hypothetical protein [Actinomycetota bacterium]
MRRPVRLVVQRARSGQAWQRRPKVALPLALIGTVSPLGQVTVRLSWSTRKSSRSNPPGTAGRSGAA